jgi:hypothetical protein
MNKLETFCEIEGLDLEGAFEQAFAGDPYMPNAICINPDCDETCTMEPDQDAGWCESCQTNSVKSILILAGLI